MLAISAITRSAILLWFGLQCCDAGIIGKRDGPHIRQTLPSLGSLRTSDPSALNNTLNADVSAKNLAATTSNDTVLGAYFGILQHESWTMNITGVYTPYFHRDVGEYSVRKARIGFAERYYAAQAAPYSPFPEPSWNFTADYPPTITFRFDQAKDRPIICWQALNSTLLMALDYVHSCAVIPFYVPSFRFTISEHNIFGSPRLLGDGYVAVDGNPPSDPSYIVTEIA